MGDLGDQIHLFSYDHNKDIDYVVDETKILPCYEQKQNKSCMII